MTPGAQIQASIDLLEMIHEAWEAGRQLPADMLMGDYFRQRRYIGAKDKGFISRRLYAVLRQGASLQWWCEHFDLRVEPRSLVLATLVVDEGLPLEVLKDYFTGERHDPDQLSDKEIKFISRALKLDHTTRATMPEWMRLNVPEWSLPPLQERFGEDLEKAAAALNEEAPVDLRTNLLKTSRDDLRYQLRQEGFHTQLTPHSPWGLRLEKRGAIFNTDAFRQGKFEVQDEGSQLVSMLVNPEPGQRVIDFCAGAGGKTLALAAQMQNKGRILAVDNSENRLAQSAKRLRRAGVDNVQTKVITSESDKFLKRHHGTADRVLIDAPCSGSGTWRRNPDLKWRFGPNDLEEILKVQASILDSASKLVKPEGLLVYVTCSVFAAENERQIEAFCLRNPYFSVANIDEIWDKENRLHHLVSGHAFAQLSPSQHQTDGFFAAVLKKTASAQSSSRASH